VAGALCVLAAARARAASIDIGSATGATGSDVMIEVSLRTMDAMVLGTQNLIEFDRETPVAAKPSGAPDCIPNPAIDKTATAFRFLPLNCDPALDCASVRAFVLALDNVVPIPDGSVLYTCRISIAPTAAVGPHALRNDETRASAAAGEPVPTTGTDGVVQVVAQTVASIDVGSASVVAGETGSVDVTLSLLTDPPAAVATVQNDLAFDPSTPIAATAENQPDCAVNPDIGKDATSFAFRPPQCTPSLDCTGVRALVAGDDRAIPDGTTLYTCTIAVGDGTPAAVYPLAASMPLLGDSSGAPLAAVTSDGSIEVTAPPPPVCVGDCDGGRTVSIDELLLGVNMAIGSAALQSCPVFNADGDNRISVNELVLAVNNALRGCPL
jgi:hypothetical protein